MQVQQTATAALLQALGVDTAHRWDASTLASKLNAEGGIARFVPEPRPELGADEDALLNEILAHQEASAEPLTVEPDATAKVVKVRTRQPTKQAKKTAANKAAGRSEYPRGFTTWTMAQKEKYWKKHPRPVPPDGIAATVVRELQHAGSLKKPRLLSKAVLLNHLKAAFPDRDPIKMEGNLNNMVPSRLRDVYGLDVVSGQTTDGARGYYIQPAAKA